MRQEAVLTPSEIEILREAQDNPNAFTDYFFKQAGEEHGWRFDENFDEEGKWQLAVHSATQTDITVIGGFGTGKTMGIGMSAITWASVTRDFKFLNVAQKQYQAKQMYDFILSMARGTRFEDFIWEKPRKPHPKLVIRYRIGKAVFESTLEFMSVDRDATGILSWEGDWINIDEAGLLQNLDEIITNIGSRMRGSIRGRERLGRFSMTSNSWENFYLWYYFDQAISDPENFLSIIVATKHNRNVTSKQYARMLSRIPPEERLRFLNGARPEGKGIYFSREAIAGCEDMFIGEVAKQAFIEQQPGYDWVKITGAGVVVFGVPRINNQLYFVVGDPGTDKPPHRNSPVIMVWRVTDFPRRSAELVYFWWGNGNGKIGPFVDKLLDLAEYYLPVKIYIDSTGTQKNMMYLINEHAWRRRFRISGDELYPDEAGFESPLGSVRGIEGLDFSGNHKNVYLQAARLLIENKLLMWPRDIVGIRAQLANYEIENDKKIPQDIVATMAMASHAIRGYFHVDPEKLLEATRAQIDRMADKSFDQGRRASEEGRSRRSSRARPQEPVAY